MARAPRPERLAVGVDLGGTWLRARAARTAAVRQHARHRGLRVPAVPVDALPGRLEVLWRRRRWRGRVAALVVASRAVWSRRECTRLARRLSGLAPRVRVLSDAQAACLGALGGRPGVLVLAGTGSIVVGRSASGAWARAGGLGPLLGDEGSAFWLGRQWLRGTGRGEDMLPARPSARRPRGPLLEAPNPVARIAGLAPRVLARARRGDARAKAIVREGARELAVCACRVARALGLPPPADASWAGSVMDSPLVRARVAHELRRLGIRVRWRAPAAEPVAAALALALRLAARPRP